MDGDQAPEDNHGSDDEQAQAVDPYGSDNEEDEFDDPAFRELTPMELLKIKRVAHLIAEDQELVNLVLSAVNTDPGNERHPLLSWKYKCEVARIVYLHFRDCGPGWLGGISKFLSYDTTKLGYLSQVPGVDQRPRRRLPQGNDWDVGFGLRFLKCDPDSDKLWPLIRPVIRLAINNLPFDIRIKNRITGRLSLKSIPNFIHSMMRKTEPEDGVWIPFKIPDTMGEHIAYIKAKESTKTKLKSEPPRKPAELMTLIWKAGDAFFTSGDWESIRWPFGRLEKGFYMLLKHVKTTAYPGDQAWNFEVYNIIETFALESTQFPNWTENGVHFSRKRSRRQFISYVFQFLTCNYYQGKLLEFVGFFRKVVEEHFAGTCCESLWFLTLELHKASGTEDMAREWLRNTILPFLPPLLDLFVDVMGWNEPDPESLLIKRENTSPETSRSTRRRRRGGGGRPRPSIQADTTAGPSNPPILPLAKRMKRNAGQDASDPSTFLFPDDVATSHILGPSSILNSAYLHQKPKKTRKLKNKGKNKEIQVWEEPVPEFPIAGRTPAAPSENVSSSANMPTPSSSVNPAPALPLQQSEAVEASCQADLHLPTPITAPSPSPSSAEPESALHTQESEASTSPSRLELDFPNLVWMSPRLQASFSFNSDSSLSPDSSLDSMQSLTDAINNIDSDKGFNVFPANEKAGNGEAPS